jgi:hypothetical protein
VLCQIGFESLGKLTPCEQDTPSTAFTFEPDIRAKPRDGPFVGAARMLFSEAEMIVEAQVG